MELGQMIFGNPVGEYELEDIHTALVMFLLDQIDRVYWNKFQDEWDRFGDPKIPGISFLPYYWGDDEIEAAKPNLVFEHSSQEICWYKYPERSMTASQDFTLEEWKQWFDGALEIIMRGDCV